MLVRMRRKTFPSATFSAQGERSASCRHFEARWPLHSVQFSSLGKERNVGWFPGSTLDPLYRSNPNQMGATICMIERSVFIFRLFFSSSSLAFESWPALFTKYARVNGELLSIFMKEMAKIHGFPRDRRESCVWCCHYHLFTITDAHISYC